MAKKFTFKKIDATKVKQSAARSASRFDSYIQEGVTVFKFKQGRNNIRVIRNPDADYWNTPIWVHSYIGSKNSSYLCPKKMGKSKQCFVCDAAEDAQRAGDKDEAKALEARERALAWVIDRDDEKSGLKLWDVGWNMAKDVDAASDTKRGVLDIGHPDDGFDISITRTGTTKNTTRYGPPVIDREATPLAESQRQQEAWLTEMQEKSILDNLKYYKNSYLADILTGKTEEKDEDEDEDEVVENKTKARNEEDEVVEDDDDAPPPTRGSRRASRDEGDDEEEQPTRRSRSQRRTSADSGDPVDDIDEETPRKKTGKRAPKDDDDEDEGEDEPPRTAVKTRKRPEPEDDEDEDEAEAAEAARWKRSKKASNEDDDEDEQPVRRERTPARSIKEDEDEDDDEDELPRRRRGR